MKGIKSISVFLLVGFMLLSSLPNNYIQTVSAAENYFIRPAEGTLTSGFGIRSGTMHYGIDIAKTGSSVPIFAGRDGKVIRSDYSSSYGNVVYIEHNISGQKWTTVYAHMSSRAVSLGQSVATGQRIGYMGDTGDSDGQHLHFETHKGSWEFSKVNAVDPMIYIGIGTPTPDPEPTLKIEDIKPSIGLNQRLGVVRNFEKTVIRTGPGASYPINKDLGANGYINVKDQYLVSDYNKGWYKIATNGWVYSEHFMYAPTNTNSITLEGANQGAIAIPNQVIIEGIKVKPDLSLNKQLGVIRGIESSVIRTGPGASYAINNNAGKEGYVFSEDQYVVYEYSNGWYRIGTNAWVYSEHNNFRPSLDIKITN